MGNRKNIAIWGTPPPPYGGMTVHISRLLPILRKNNISYSLYKFSNAKVPNVTENEVYNARSIRWLYRMVFGNVERVHYVITVRPWVRFVAVMFGIIRGRKIILRIGGASLKKGIAGKSRVNKLLTIIALRNASAIIGVNNEISDIAIKYGAPNDRVFTIPGFIPPRLDGLIISDEVLNFKKGKWPCIVITGRVVDKNNYDLYGILMTLKVISMIKLKYPNLGLFIFAQNGDNVGSCLNNILDSEIKQYKLLGSVMIIPSRYEFLSVLKESDIFVRPTFSDGDANSIREALYFKIPVVASDCVKRPNGVYTFETGNHESFLNTLKSIIPNIENIKSDIQKVTIDDNSTKIISVINNLYELPV
jgi:glycosyltransferase involved in cell wall biosynthesis